MHVRTPLTLGALALVVLAGSLSSPVSAAVHVHDGVHRTLQEQGRVSIVLSLKEQRPDDILQPVGENREATTSSTSSSSTKEVQSDSDTTPTSPAQSPASDKKKKNKSKKACMDHEGEARDADSVAGDADSTVAADADADADAQHVQDLVDRLTQYTEEKHQEVMAVIQEDAVNSTTPDSGAAKSLWITNEIYVRDATPELIEKLKEVPTLGSIREEVVAKLSIQESRAAVMDDSDIVGEWGVQRIQAPEVWKLGYFGRNIRVGSIDSGVRVTHSALKGNFIGDYGWYDPISKSATPNDPGDHGTAVMGIIAGNDGFGAAPKSQWMSCRACDADQRCREGDLLECAQFMTCPFLNGDKSKTDCSKKPHVLNNSWNSERGVDVFNSAIDVWISAGIIPVFSNGNNGPGCGSVNSPSDQTTAITVGSTDYDDLLSGFSGRGPGLKGEIKPDLTAPGEWVVAPGITADDSFSVYTGTSFSAPHVSGAVALLLEAFPGLTTRQVKNLLMQNTDTDVLSLTSQPLCGTLNAAAQFPNNAFGYGRVNVLKAFNAQKIAAAASATSAGSAPRSASSSSGSFASGNASTPAVASVSSFNATSSSSEPGTVNVGDY
ncbi:hypothetical protein Gpo141_00003915 [Globisporangium polare]